METLLPAKAIPNRPPEIQEARSTLRRKGYSQFSGAAALGVSRVHLTYVLNGRRVSARILRAIQELPENPTPA